MSAEVGLYSFLKSVSMFNLYEKKKFVFGQIKNIDENLCKKMEKQCLQTTGQLNLVKY